MWPSSGSSPKAPRHPGWEPASLGDWDVTARLGSATTEVHLASWPAAPDNWPPMVRPTVHEVTDLCAALAFATDALDLVAAHLGVNVGAARSRKNRGSLTAPDDDSAPDRPHWRLATFKG